MKPIIRATAILCAALFVWPSVAPAQTTRIITLEGDGVNLLRVVQDLATDGSGNVFVTGLFSHKVF